MTTTLIAAVALTMAPASQEAQKSGAALISEMMARYSTATTLKGTINLAQTVGNESGGVSTTIQYERPAKLFLRQVKQTANSGQFLVTSDGKRFSYPRPAEGVGTANRLVEYVAPVKETDTIGGIYAASSKSIVDRSAPLDLAIGRIADLRFLKETWATVVFDGTDEFRGEKVFKISGRWREYGEAPISGSFLMLINEAKDLRFYRIVENIGLAGAGAVTVVSDWEVKLDVNGKVDENLFKVIL